MKILSGFVFFLMAYGIFISSLSASGTDDAALVKRTSLTRLMQTVWKDQQALSVSCKVDKHPLADTLQVKTLSKLNEIYFLLQSSDTISAEDENKRTEIESIITKAVDSIMKL